VERKYIILIAVLVVAFIVGVSALIVSSNSSGGGQSGVSGLSEAKAPWPPNYTGLATRLRDLNIPPPGNETYHIHARLSVFVDGKQVPVPANIGLGGGSPSALHTHDDSGIIHIESDAAFPAKISDFLAVWGVKFSNTQLGGYKNEGSKTVQVFVNGQPVQNPQTYELKPHDSVVVGYGAPNSFPTNDPTPFPSGL
jgi:hypothetical protein